MRRQITRWLLTLALLLGALALPAPAAALLPLLDLSESLVAPGDTVRVTVAGPPGAYFALGASTGGTGLVIGDTALDLGPDAQVVGTGQLDGLGRARVEFVPAFGAAPKLYLQAITAPTPDFAALDTTPGKVLRSLEGVRSSLTVWSAPAAARPATPTGPETAVADAEPGPARGDRAAPAADAPALAAPTATRTADLALTGNLLLPASSPAAGNVLHGGVLFLHALGLNNTFLGANAGNLALTGAGNTAVGSSALANNTTGENNTASGVSALASNTTGFSNTASGVSALTSNTTGANNTAVGVSALASNTTGSDNTASGVSALTSNTTGANNTASGVSALTSNTTGSDNTASGVSALLLNTTGVNNTAVGGNALFNNTTGNRNTASGVSALTSNTTGNSNTASGVNALFNNTTGSTNTAVGGGALFNTTGNFNTAVGGNALATNTTGNSNIALGTGAGALATTGSDNIYIGDVGGNAEGNTLRLGTPGLQTRAFVAGIRGVATDVANGIIVLVDSNGQLGTASSSRRFKEDIRDMGDASTGLLHLRPVTFRYTAEHAPGPRPRQYGLLAEEVADVYPDLVVHTAEGEILSVQYHVLPALLLNELQRQHRRGEAQAQQIEALTARVAELIARVTRDEPEVREPTDP